MNTPRIFLAGLIVWNDFFTALIFLSGSDNQTLTVSMYNYVGSLVSAWNRIFSFGRNITSDESEWLRPV